MSDRFMSLLSDDVCVRWLFTLLHFLWQGAVVGGVAAIAGRLLRGASARSRYALYSAALLILPVSVVVTFCVVDVPTRMSLTSQLGSPANLPAQLSVLPPQATETAAPVQTEDAEATDALVFHERVMRMRADADDHAVDNAESLSLALLPLLSRAAPWIAVAYVAGVVCFLLRLSTALWGGHRLRTSTAIVTDATLLDLIADQANRVKLKCVPAVAYCERVAVPTVVGVLRPIVLLPTPLMTGLSTDDFAAIIRHELAHIRRYDLWMNLLQRVIESLLFFHPVVWFISRRLSAEREVCCDDLVVSSGYEPLHYAGALLRMAELCASSRRSGALALAATGDEKPLLERRIERLINWGNTPPLRLTRAGMAGLLLTVGSLIVVPGIVHSWAAQAQVQEVGQLAAGDLDSLDHKEAKANDVAESTSRGAVKTAISGQVTDSDGKPVPHAFVAAYATRIRFKHVDEHALDNFALAESATDEQGNYELEFSGVNSRTHGAGFVIARRPGKAMAWKQLNLDDHSVQQSLSMEKEVPIHGRLVDLQGQPADGVEMRVAAVSKRSPNYPRIDVPQIYAPHAFDEAPAAWLPSIRSDPTGRFTVQGVSQEYGVRLRMVENERFAVQEISINTGEPEERRHEQSYHELVRNVALGDEALLPIAPAQFLHGTVTYEDTGLPVPFAQVEVGCRQHKFGVGRVVRGRADENGEYRISAMPGSYFAITALPPGGEPYLVRQTPLENTIIWQDGDASRRADLTLPRGVLVHGTVVETESGRPIAGAVVQYEPERASNPNTADDIATGSRTRQVSDESGRFEIGVLPGPGRLLVHGPDGKYVSKVLGSRELVFGTPGGMREFVHGWKRINPAEDTEHLEVAIELQLGSKARGQLIDESGEPIEEAQVVSLLSTGSSYSRTWGRVPKLLGGRFEFSSLEDGHIYPVHFLDQKRRLGATIQLEAGSESKSVVLRSCGEARARIVDEKGQPRIGARVGLELVIIPGPHRVERAAARRGELFAVTAHIQMVDSTNYIPAPQSDDNGVITFPALIPGAKYRILTFENQTIPRVQAEFSVEPGQSIDLGDLHIPSGSQTYVLK